MKPANNIEKAIKKELNFSASAKLHDRMLTDVLNAQEKSKKTPSALTEPNIGRTIMKSPITKLAVAAVLAVVCLTGFYMWTGGQSGIALADVVARMEQAKAYACQMSATFRNQDVDEMPISHAKVLIARDLGMKTNIEIHHPITGQSVLQEIYVLLPERTITTLMPNEKKYSQLEFDEASFEGWRGEYDPQTMVKRILNCKHTSLGRSTIDGVEVESFQTTDPNFMDGSMGEVDVKIWAAVKTSLPVRIEVDKSEENKGHLHIVVCDFRWDVPVDAAEFEPVIPDHYTPGRPMLQILPKKKPAADEETSMNQEAEKKKRAMQAEMGMKMLAMSKQAVIDEEAAIKGLKLFAELDSSYPEALDMPVLVSELARIVKGGGPSAKAFRETIQGMTDEEAMNYKLETVLSAQGLGRFYQTLVQDKKDPAYYGKSVTPEDADQVLMRWKVSDNEYRVIFGTLKAETVTAEALAELEKLPLE